MAGALLGAVSCLRCGGDLDPAGGCPACALGPLPAASGSAVQTTGPLTGVSRAGLRRRNIAVAIDLAPVVVVGAGVGYAAATHPLTGVGWYAAAAITGLLYLLGQLIAITLRGRTSGRLALALRTVDDLTGTPVTLAGFLRRIGAPGWTRRTVTADLRRGRDPMVPVAAHVLAAAYPAVPGLLDPAEPASAWAVSIVLDTGERHVVHNALVIGRLPEVVESGIPLLAWPDMTRKLARTHALLEWSGSVLWVTDLHSAYGTVLVSPAGERRPLVPGLRGAAVIGWRVECGGRSFTVERVRRKDETPAGTAGVADPGSVVS